MLPIRSIWETAQKTFPNNLRMSVLDLATPASGSIPRSGNLPPLTTPLQVGRGASVCVWRACTAAAALWGSPGLARYQPPHSCIPPPLQTYSKLLHDFVPPLYNSFIELRGAMGDDWAGEPWAWVEGWGWG